MSLSKQSRIQTRRRLLQLAAFSPFAAATASAACAPISPQCKARFTATLNLYSFHEQLNANMADVSKGLDILGVCDFCVKHDIEAVDLTCYFFRDFLSTGPKQVSL